jgi:hypothetical protein
MLQLAVLQMLLNAIAENLVISAAEATKKIVHVLLENSAATRKETVFIGKELIRPENTCPTAMNFQVVVLVTNVMEQHHQCPT